MFFGKMHHDSDYATNDVSFLEISIPFPFKTRIGDVRKFQKVKVGSPKYANFRMYDYFSKKSNCMFDGGIGSTIVMEKVFALMFQCFFQVSNSYIVLLSQKIILRINILLMERNIIPHYKLRNL